MREAKRAKQKQEKAEAPPVKEETITQKVNSSQNLFLLAKKMGKMNLMQMNVKKTT